MKKLYLIINDNPEEQNFISNISVILKNLLDELDKKGVIMFNGTKLNAVTSELVLNILTTSKSQNVRHLPTPSPSVVLGELEVFFGETLKKLKKIQSILIKELDISSTEVSKFKDMYSQLFDRVVNIVPDYNSIEELVAENTNITAEDAVLIIGKCPNEFRKEIEKTYSNINCYCVSDSTEKDTINKLITFLNDTKSMG